MRKVALTKSMAAPTTQRTRPPIAAGRSPQTPATIRASEAEIAASSSVRQKAAQGHLQVSTFEIFVTGPRSLFLMSLSCASRTRSWVLTSCGMIQAGTEGMSGRGVTWKPRTECSGPSSYFTLTSPPFVTFCTFARRWPSSLLTTTREPGDRPSFVELVHFASRRPSRSSVYLILGTPLLKTFAAQAASEVSSKTRPWRSCSTTRRKNRTMEALLRQRATRSKPSCDRGAFAPPNVMALRTRLLESSTSIPASSAGMTTHVSAGRSHVPIKAAATTSDRTVDRHCRM
mmetsp:Transcript_137691/g.427785  ORF Transcript_137691/g.427785 Transcript_137691/m.427785 type:complete len:287 (+) Transcript_137691:308-1168(+)